MTPGQVAYEAYSVAVGGASAVTGTVLPSWDGQRPDIREAWEVAADAVRRYVTPWGGDTGNPGGGDFIRPVDPRRGPSGHPIGSEADGAFLRGDPILLPPNTPQPG